MGAARHRADGRGALRGRVNASGARRGAGEPRAPGRRARRGVDAHPHRHEDRRCQCADDADPPRPPADRSQAHRRPGAGDRRPGGEGDRRARQVPALDLGGLPQGLHALAGLLLRHAPAQARDRAGARRRRHRRRARGVDRPAGRVDDGARLRRGLRTQGQRALRLDPAADPVRRAVRRPAPPVSHAPPGPARAVLVQRLAGLLQPREHQRVGPAQLPAAALPARPADVGGGAPRAARGGVGAPRAPRPPEPLRLLVPATWLAVGTVFLLGFRIGLNVTNSNVIDVGYSGVIGADRLAHGHALYGTFPKDDPHGDTYGPATYAAYVPFELALPWHGRWDDLPAAHGAAILFDLLACGGLFLLGRRVRGPTVGLALAYAWAAFPFTLFALNTNANDALVAALLIGVLLVLARPVARGVMVALAAAAKFAPLALAPLFATAPPRRTLRYALGFGAVALIAMLPA